MAYKKDKQKITLNFPVKKVIEIFFQLLKGTQIQIAILYFVLSFTVNFYLPKYESAIIAPKIGVM